MTIENPTDWSTLESQPNRPPNVIEIPAQEASIKRWEWGWILPWKAYKAMDTLDKEARETLKVYWGKDRYKSRTRRRNIASSLFLVHLMLWLAVLWFGLIQLVEYSGIDAWLQGFFS